MVAITVTDFYTFSV